MTIYRLNYRVVDYPRVEISEDEKERLPNGRETFVPGLSRKDQWVKLDASLYYGSEVPKQLPLPDLTTSIFEFIVSNKALDYLRPIIGRYGEFLPISVDGNVYYIFNLLNSTDAIDPFNSKKEYFDGIEIGVKKIAFIEHEVKDLLIFNSPYDEYAYTYCTEKFKDIIEGSGLSSGWEFLEDLREVV